MKQEFRSKPREEALEKIECYIAQHNLKPHDKLPSERDMCDMWGFNRTTLRSAIQSLILDGRLYNKKGSGTFVAPPKLVRNLQDLKSFSEVVIESGGILETILLHKNTIESNKQISKALCITLGHPILELVRMRLIDNEPVMIETTYLDYERFKETEEHDFMKESLYAVIADLGVKVSKGSEKIEITFATDKEAELLQVDEGIPLFYISGVVSDEEGIPVEYFKTIARPDKIRFSTKLTR